MTVVSEVGGDEIPKSKRDLASHPYHEHLEAGGTDGGYSATSGNADGDGAGGSGYFPGADDEGNGSDRIQLAAVAIIAAVMVARLM